MTRPLTSFHRDLGLKRLAEEEFDVLVVGGGVTGAGVALDAAARGWKVALVERDDFASGTSSKSSKLVHGGLRYLQQKEFALVHENLAERHRLLHNAPHLVEPLSFLIPLFGKGGIVDKSIVKGYSAALWLYDLAGGWRIGKRHKKVSAEQIYAHLPTLKQGRVVAGFLYYDARTDDARLTLALARTAVLHYGAVAANYCEVTALSKDRAGRVQGATVVAKVPGVPAAAPVEVRAKAVVNATGVWADAIRSLAGEGEHHDLRPAKGVHITVPSSKLPCDVAAIIPVPADRRAIFVIPWGDHTYVGTTDTDFEGSLDDPPVTEADVDYVLAAVNAVVSEPIRREDVTGTWAGLRPLLAATADRKAPSERTADLSRRHRVIVAKDGLVTITGGKLTTYRKMAADTVDAVAESLGHKAGPSPTKRLKLRGAAPTSGRRRGGDLRSDSDGAGGTHAYPPPHQKPPPHRKQPSVAPAGGPAQLARRYGSEAPAVAAIAARHPDLSEPLVDGLPYLAAEAVYAVRYEMAETLADVMARRTRAVLLDAAASREAAPRVAALMARELGWDEERVRGEVEAFEGFVAAEMAPVTGAG